MWSLFSGFSLGLSLIVAIGGQNIWVLSQSMAGANRLVIATVCILCDVLLILVGVSFIGQLQVWLPPLVPILTIAGVLMLLYLAYGSAKRVVQGSSGLLTNDNVQRQSPKIIGFDRVWHHLVKSPCLFGYRGFNRQSCQCRSVADSFHRWRLFGIVVLV